MSIILGINAFHADSSACLLIDGQIIAAVEEERFTRVKHWCGFPKEAIRYVLESAGLSIPDLTHVAVNSDDRAALIKKSKYLLTNKVNWSLLDSRIKNRSQRNTIELELMRMNYGRMPKAALVRVEHHLSHGAACWYSSPFKDAAVVSVDGFGDFSSTMTAIGSHAGLDSVRRVHFPHSLGVFYQAITQLLGFDRYGDEYKVMGLAAYGKPIYLNLMNDIAHSRSSGSFELNMRYFVHGDRPVFNPGKNGSPEYDLLFTPDLEDLLGSRRTKDTRIAEKHFNIACSAQRRYEELLFHVLNQAYLDSNRSGNLCLSGGCAMNSVANGKITTNTPFNNVYIQPAAGDSGGALGAALWTYYNGDKVERSTESSFPVRCARSVADYVTSVVTGKAASKKRRARITRVVERYANEQKQASGASFQNADATELEPMEEPSTLFHSGLSSGVSMSTKSKRAYLFDPYLGPSYDESDMMQATEDAVARVGSGKFAEHEYRDDESLYEFVATQISKGAVVGWYQGRLEWGARALGNRSILADPRKSNIRELLNVKIKQREVFRPFAPSVLSEAMHEWFETDQTPHNARYNECADLHTYMMSTCMVRPSKRSVVPSITHVDGSARPQSVREDINPRFYRLIKAFARLTGVPMLVNTSFNENEPIVSTPQHAMACFLRTDIDMLVLGNTVVSRSGVGSGVELEKRSLLFSRSKDANLPLRREVARNPQRLKLVDKLDIDVA